MNDNTINANTPQQTHATLESNNNEFALDPSTRNNTQMRTSQVFMVVATLANKLPTGTILAFQMLAPIFTNQGECTHVSRVLTWILIGCCLLSVVVLSFTDSVKDKHNNVAYGFVTINGLWMLDYTVQLPTNLAANYRLNPLDFVHAFMGVLLFITIAMLDSNTVKCFVPKPSDNVMQLLRALPIGIGVLCSVLFLWFPTQRNGIGFPSPNSITN